MHWTRTTTLNAACSVKLCRTIWQRHEVVQDDLATHEVVQDNLATYTVAPPPHPAAHRVWAVVGKMLLVAVAMVLLPVDNMSTVISTVIEPHSEIPIAEQSLHR